MVMVRLRFVASYLVQLLPWRLINCPEEYCPRAPTGPFPLRSGPFSANDETDPRFVDEESATVRVRRSALADDVRSWVCAGLSGSTAL